MARFTDRVAWLLRARQRCTLASMLLLG